VTRRRFLFDPPDRFVAGAVGVPGQRTFLLQAREGRRIVSVSLEKAQVAVLADRLGQLLEELAASGASTAGGRQPEDTDPLDEPLNEAFRATALTLGWDAGAGRVLIEARAESDADDEAIAAMLDDEDEDGPDLLRVRLTAEAARVFVDRAVEVVNAGRPPCPVCGRPLDPQGHICPRRNGHYVH
jgi:uncharacterized repeat protein (TIGR03847 family)